MLSSGGPGAGAAGCRTFTSGPAGALAVGPTDQWVVPLRPEQVVEIAFDGVQTSSRYPGGLALRFARVVRYRDDKSAAEADTIDMVRSLYAD